jgi:hypothetical protein
VPCAIHCIGLVKILKKHAIFELKFRLLALYIQRDPESVMLDTFYLASFTGRTNEKFEIFCKIKLFSKQFHPYKNKYYRKTLFGDIKRLTSSELHCIYITILLLKTQTIIFIKNILQTSILILIKSRKQETYSGRNV